MIYEPEMKNSFPENYPIEDEKKFAFHTEYYNNNCKRVKLHEVFPTGGDKVAYHDGNVYINYNTHIAKCGENKEIQIITSDDECFGRNSFVVNNRGIWVDCYDSILVFDETGILQSKISIKSEKDWEKADLYIYDDKIYVLFERYVNNGSFDGVKYKIIQYSLNGEKKELFHTDKIETILYKKGLEKVEQERKMECEEREEKYKPLQKSDTKIVNRNKYDSILMANSVQVIFSFYMEYDLIGYTLSNHIILRIHPESGEYEFLEFGTLDVDSSTREIVHFDMLHNMMWFKEYENYSSEGELYKAKIQPIEQVSRTKANTNEIWSLKRDLYSYFDGEYMFGTRNASFYSIDKNGNRIEWKNSNGIMADSFRIYGNYLFHDNASVMHIPGEFDFVPKALERPDESKWWRITTKSILEVFNRHKKQVEEQVTENNTDNKNHDLDGNDSRNINIEEFLAPDNKEKESQTIKCRNCGTKIPVQSKFCLECGTPVKLVCSNCGIELPQNSKFCLECGHKVK